MATTTAYVTTHTWAPEHGRNAGTEATYRLAHARQDCPDAQGAEAVPGDPAAIGWPCACVDVPGGNGLMVGDGGAAADAAAPSLDPRDRAPGGPTGTGAAAYATDKQVAFALRLYTERGAAEPGTDAYTALEAGLRKMSKAKASEVIDGLLATPVPAKADAPAGHRPNRYAATCADCGNDVAEQAGALTKEGGRWTTRHLPGQCPAPTAGPAKAQAPAAPEADVPAGYYAIPSKGDNDLLFVAVDRPTEGRWAGRTFVKAIIGGDRGGAIRGAQAADVLARIAEAGPAEAAALYGQQIGRCGACNRTLTDEESRQAGIGPVCRDKGWG